MSLVVKLLLIACSICIATTAVAQTEESAPVEKTAATGEPVVYLELEAIPYKNTGKRVEKYPLFRELARQSCFIALHETLGHHVRDEVLGEEVPIDVPVTHLALLSRFPSGQKEGLKSCNLRLHLVDPDDQEVTVQDLWFSKRKPEWEHTVKNPHELSKLVLETVIAFEKFSREEMLEGLKAAGIEPAKHNSPAPDKTLDVEQAEAMLREMDYIKQFAVVRDVHRAMKHEGETPELLGMLVRGYANIALLTEQHWNMVSDAYAARSLLYAQRMLVKTENSAEALWHRAYALTLTGSQRQASADLETLKELTSDDVPPTWTKVLEPMNNFDRDVMRELIENEESLNELARRMLMQIDFVYRYPSRINATGVEMIREVPTSYGSYAIMARYGKRLSTTRMGAAYGPMALLRFAPESLDSLEDLPESVRALLPTTQAKAAMIRFTLPDPNPNDAFSPVPTAVASKLRKVSQEKQTGALSWSALGYLLEEEVFLQAINDLRVSTNATERSLERDVASVLPFVRNHPYVKYLQSFAINRRRDPKAFEEMFTEFEWHDPVPVMWPLLDSLWKIENSEGVNLRNQGYYTMTGNPTVAGYTMRAIGYGSIPTSKSYSDFYAWHLRQVAPNCDVWVRMAVNGRKDPSLERLKEWEADVRSDPITWSELAKRYYQLGATDDAIRCYEESLDGLVTSTAAMNLADIFYAQKEYEKWEATLSRALNEIEDLGLEHAWIHKRFTWGYAKRGMWKEAKPHAVEEGNTWSAWGLQDASQICEALAQWEESEEWMREASTSYPSGSAQHWYFWCARTGRGNMDAAREMAENYFEHENYGSTYGHCEQRGFYRLLEGRHEEALESFQRALEAKPSFIYSMMVAQLSRQIGKNELFAQTVANMKKTYADMKPEDKGVQQAIGEKLLALLDKENITDEELALLDTQLTKLNEYGCCNYTFMLAWQLDFNSQDELADKYYRRSLLMPTRGFSYTTLAGARLAEQRGTSRRVDDVLDEGDVWKAPEVVAPETDVDESSDDEKAAKEETADAEGEGEDEAEAVEEEEEEEEGPESP